MFVCVCVPVRVCVCECVCECVCMRLWIWMGMLMCIFVCMYFICLKITQMQVFCKTFVETIDGDVMAPLQQYWPAYIRSIFNNKDTVLSDKDCFQLTLFSLEMVSVQK